MRRHIARTETNTFPWRVLHETRVERALRPMHPHVGFPLHVEGGDTHELRSLAPARPPLTVRQYCEVLQVPSPHAKRVALVTSDVFTGSSEPSPIASSAESSLGSFDAEHARKVTSAGASQSTWRRDIEEPFSGRHSPGRKADADAFGDKNASFFDV